MSVLRAFLMALLFLPAAQATMIIGLEGTPRDLQPGDAWHGHPVVSVDPVLHVLVLDAAPGDDAWHGLPGVRFAEEPLPVQASAFAPNDFYWGHSQHYSAGHMGADDLWDLTTGGTAKDVCIVDTGIYDAHEDIDATRLLGEYDFVNGDADATDDHHHGTWVAGNLLATIDNTVGMSGIAQQQFYVAKVLDQNGNGNSIMTAQGIRWCADQGASIINLSLGGTGYSQYQRDAVSYAVGKGALVLAATGNDATDGVDHYPASYPEAMGIGCTDDAMARCSFSNGGDFVSLVAPGNGVISTDIDATNDYIAWSGTSASTPNAAGIAALVWELNPGLSNWEIRAALESGATDLGTSGFDEVFGFGLANGPAAHTAAQAMGQSLSTVYTETFDDGLAQDWILQGHWNVDDACPFSVASGGSTLAYTSGCQFDAYDNPTGSAMFRVDLGDADEASLTFAHRWDTEDTTPDTTANTAQTSRDQMEVQVRPVGQTDWNTLAFWDSRDAEPSDFESVSLSLTPFAGQSVDIRFRFTATDSSNNGDDGWFVDNVIVRSDGATGLVGALDSWFLTDGTTGTQTDEDYWMERGSGAGSALVFFTQGSTETRTWAANEEAAVAINFGQGTWGFDFHHTWYYGVASAVQLTAELGTTNQAGAFVQASTPITDTVTTGSAGQTLAFRLTPSEDFTVPAGHRVALQVTADLASGQAISMETRGSNSPSVLSAGINDSGYPTPLPATLLLLLAGLGLVAVTKRRA